MKEFVRATGARRGGLIHLTKEDLREREDGQLEIHLKEKNGMERWARVDPTREEFVKEIFKEKRGIEINGEVRLFNKEEINCCQELHSCRTEYAVKMYSLFEKEGYANNQIYYCRKDMKGLSFDKGILKKVSENLGHHRLDVVVSHYLYK